jgi:cytochrome oxidase Cu insertion factor (SCO1/SenC/PrrC family)
VTRTASLDSARDAVLSEVERTAEEPITHSVRLVLVDRQGRIRGYYDASEKGAMERLRRDAQRLLPQGSS